MFDAAHDDAGERGSAWSGAPGVFDHRVIGFTARTGKDDLAGIGSDECGDFIPGGFDKFSRGLSGMMKARRVAVFG